MATAPTVETDIRPAQRSRRVLVWNIARLVLVAAILWAIIVQFRTAISDAHQLGRHVPTVVANFFSFFTILSNSATAIFLTVSAVFAFRALRDGRRLEPRWLSVATVCAATYMIVTGVVYNILLRPNQDPLEPVDWWSNEVLHLIGPVFMLADLIVAPLRGRLPWRTIWTIVAFPVAWTIYTLIRGELVTSPITGEAWWYPYPFLDWRQVAGGWWGVIGYMVAIAALIGLVAWGTVWATRRFGAPGDEAAEVDEPVDHGAAPVA